jgi:uncharacterized membrane protein YfcA
MWKKASATGDGPPQSHRQATRHKRLWLAGSPRRRAVSLVAGAIVTGILSGLFGVGGGFIIVPILMYLLAITINEAVATSLLIISLVAGTGFANSLITAHSVPLNRLLEVVFGGILGMSLGLYIGKIICTSSLQKTFSVMALVMAALVVSKHFS